MALESAQTKNHHVRDKPIVVFTIKQATSGERDGKYTNTVSSRL